MTNAKDTWEGWEMLRTVWRKSLNIFKWRVSLKIEKRNKILEVEESTITLIP